MTIFVFCANYPVNQPVQRFSSEDSALQDIEDHIVSVVSFIAFAEATPAQLEVNAERAKAACEAMLLLVEDI